MNTTKLILVGGFLGAGKTSLLWEAAKQAMSKGKRVGLITNDQAPDLVDTTLLCQNDVKVSEVSGSCFCCNFDGFLDAVNQVQQKADADIIIAEPVGSCTDLSATIIQPLKDSMKKELSVSPLSVLADPTMLKDILNGGNAELHISAAYIYKKQLEESDIILISKDDLLSSDELTLLKEKTKVRFPDSELQSISSTTGEGVKEWLNDMLTRDDAGKRIVDVDYDIYAEGEAVLGWLNSNIGLESEGSDWDIFVRDLMNSLSEKFDSNNMSVGHVKLILESDCKYIVANLTGKKDTISFRNSAGKSKHAKLTLNARVETSPSILKRMVKEALATAAGKNIKHKILTMRCISPGRPKPTHRYDNVVM
ncbi:MAG: GTP-binding protein [Bacteroidales bacterium]